MKSAFILLGTLGFSIFSMAFSLYITGFFIGISTFVFNFVNALVFG